MGHLTWKLELGYYRASAIGSFGIYILQGGPERHWVAEFTAFPLDSNIASVLVLSPTVFRDLGEAFSACQRHATMCAEWAGPEVPRPPFPVRN